MGRIPIELDPGEHAQVYGLKIEARRHKKDKVLLHFTVLAKPEARWNHKVEGPAHILTLATHGQGELDESA